MKHVRTLVALFLSLTLTPMAGAQETKSFNGTIRIGGSTTLLPVIADATSQFMEKYETWDKVDPSFPKSRILIYVTGGGSGFGIKAVMDGTVNIGMSSRDLKDAEKAQLAPYKEFLVSKDCLAFAVNKKNPLAKKDNFTREEIARIFSGEAKTFRDIDPSLPNKPILIQMRDAAGGSTEIVKTMILKEKNFSPGAIQVPSQGANLKKLETNTSAIGYLSSVIAQESSKLKIFKYEGVAPTNENVINGQYRISRPLLLLVTGTPEPTIHRFIDYVLNDGQKIIQEHGYVPVKTLR
ncbi:MAG: phosphate ABC transporter substrate-binding protein [Deltaproteobacteria bacterium]|nr:MAG: phosphate ABC transporter substrate-binding protein [Deltaproteobacteria bacterium]